ncbi:Glycosyltransferase involved in cell wall bisynthesis [Asanoa hainanensis]|uniref:Glycosyltransferase involved in cell wall bisynthesis n=1 Tax=Asanoa hainanensis TaxID=560556 RepID=A0A239NT09_9ACTN|nr:Glycosyltransferase involved in cell wall bisynthesis [Asanoa hainanensis]
MWRARLSVIESPDSPAPFLGAGTSINSMCVSAASLADLRVLLDHPAGGTMVRALTVFVERWQNPEGTWSGRLGALPHLLSHRIRLPAAGPGRAGVALEVRRPAPLRQLIMAVLPVFTSVRPLPRAVSADITVQDVAPPWVGSTANVAVVSGTLPTDDDIRPHDLVLSSDGTPLPPDGASTAQELLFGGVIQAGTAGVGGTVLVDVEHSACIGRYGPFGPATPVAGLVFAGDDWRIDGPDGPLVSGRTDGQRLAPEEIAALAKIGVVRCASVPCIYPAGEAAVLVRLAAAGVLVHAPDLRPPVAAHLADELRPLVVGELPTDDLEWEVRAVRQRRAALRQHATAFALPRLARDTFPALVAPPSVSVLLVTRRLEHVASTVAAIERQTYPDLEIVLCLHGAHPSAELLGQVARCSRPVELVAIGPEQRFGFGEAIGRATARARGSLITKFDDDDNYGPEHVWDLVLARLVSGATLVGKAAEFVHLHALDTTVRRQNGRAEHYAGVVAGGTMLISRGDLEEVGGWRPVPRSIDRGLISRVTRSGGLVYRTHPLGYIYHRRAAGHTWDPGLEYFLRDNGPQWPGLPRHSEFGTGVAELPLG